MALEMSLWSFTDHGVITASIKSASHSMEIDSDQHARSHDVLEELAVHYRDVGLSDNISIAKIDVSSNDVPELITSYPTLKLYPACRHPPVTFQGNYHEPIPLVTLVSFTQDHGKNQQEVRPLQHSDSSTMSEAMTLLEARQAVLASKSSNKANLGQQHTKNYNRDTFKF